MSNLILVRLDIVLISAQDRCTVSLNVPRAWKSFWAHPMILLRDVGQVQARFGPFRDRANLYADRCTVCAERTIGSEIILDAPDATPR